MVSVLEDGADGFNTEMIIPAGEDPHIYEPKASDLRVLGNADLTLYHGLNFEGRLSDVLEEGISVTEGFNENSIKEMQEENETAADPISGLISVCTNRHSQKLRTH